MEFLKLSVLFLAISLMGCGDNTESSNTDQAESNIEIKDSLVSYDSLYAQKLGADEMGMRKYVMAFLKRGPNRNQDSVTKAKLQRAHLDNIKRLANEGTLVMAGPFFDDGDIRGIYVFAVDSLSQAEALTNSDPAVKAGSLVMELHEWYGSAAVMEVNRIHEQIAKTSF